MDQTTPVEKAEAAMKFEKFEIVSDGTKGGTKVLVNGKPVANMTSLSLYWYDSDYCPISFSYTVADPEVKPGQMGSYTTYRLRCPIPASAQSERAEASLAAPEQMEFDFATASKDEALEAHNLKDASAFKPDWAKL